MKQSEQFQRVQSLFARCVDLPGEEVEALLADTAPDIAEQVRRLLAADSQPAPVTESLRPVPPEELPQQIGPYRVLDRIATGGMGEVFVAEQVEPVRRRVAIKVIRVGMDSAEVLARFDSERQALAMMNHANIARIIDAGSSDSARPYFVMEYVPGVPILEYCDEHRLSIRERLELFITICNAVQHAHQKGIIHRDLKPSNVLVMEQDGKPFAKVIDFGVAKAVNSQLTERTLHTRLGHVIGTPDYMSPEQAELSPLDIDTRTDVYSLGVIFYELLCGRVPFHFSRSTSLLTLRDTLKTEAVPPLGQWLTREPVEGERAAAVRSSSVPELSRLLRGELESIAYMALAKAPQSRYPTAAALADDVRHYLEGDSVRASSKQRFYQARKLLWRHRFGLAATLVAFLLVSAFAGMMALQASAIRLERDRANQEARTSQQVAEFLEEVFRQAGPFEAQGRALSAIDLVDEGVQRLPERMPEPSLARLRLGRILGQVYTDLGRFEKANAMLLMAVEDSRQMLGAQHPETLVAISELSRNQWALGDLEAAESGYREVLSVYRRAPDRRQSAARTLANLGGLQMTRRHYGAALATLQEARAEIRAAFGEEHINVALIGANIATALSSLGKGEESVVMFDEILPRIESDLGERHPHVLGIKSNLGSELVELGEFDRALPLLEEVLATQVDVIGPDHPDALFTEGLLATGRIKAGNTTIDELDDVIRRLATVRGEDSREALRFEIGRGVIMAGNDIEQGLSYLREIEQRALESLGPRNEIAAQACLQQSLLLARAGRDASVPLGRFLEQGGEAQRVLDDDLLGPAAREIPAYRNLP